ncbi:MAG: DUF4388 domain-containing protein [Anaerolineales bacterium]|nr:DUF4388 domain-containing protein [Anaerolineales bacterium]
MALKGNLRDFTITQLLNLVNLAKKTGTLVVEGANQSARITFREGKLAYAEISNEDNGLGAVLHKNKIITRAQYNTISKRAKTISDKELGLMLINAGYVDQRDVIISLQNHFMDILQRLFSWVEGIFYFNPGETPPPDRIPIKMDLENIIIEGSRRLREWEQLQDELPNLDLALKFTDRPGVNIQNLNMSVEEWKVVSYINPKNTIRQIGKAAKMSEMEIRRVVYSLLQAGLVELVRPEGMVRTLPGLDQTMAGKSKEEQENLVNRLIGRIRQL